MCTDMGFDALDRNCIDLRLVIKSIREEVKEPKNRLYLLIITIPSKVNVIIKRKICYLQKIT